MVDWTVELLDLQKADQKVDGSVLRKADHSASTTAGDSVGCSGRRLVQWTALRSVDQLAGAKDVLMAAWKAVRMAGLLGLSMAEKWAVSKVPMLAH
jgi:hypothetical protein